MAEDTRTTFERCLAICPQVAARYGVRPDVHPDDFIFQFVVDHPLRKVPEVGVEYYFADGQRSVKRLGHVLRDVCGWSGEPIDLLEFASGYGCVSRHFRTILPEVALTSCDIHPAAVDFVSGTFGLPAVVSCSVPEELDVPSRFDVVFALSFFSHMPKGTWTRWMRALSGKLKPGGVLVFTTHGLTSKERFGFPVEIDSDGFWFKELSEQKDLDVLDYGVSCTTPQFVFREVEADSRGRLIYFREGFWWEHQDLFVWKRHPVQIMTSVERQQLAGPNGFLNPVEAQSIQVEEARRRSRACPWPSPQG